MLSCHVGLQTSLLSGFVIALITRKLVLDTYMFRPNMGLKIALFVGLILLNTGLQSLRTIL